MTKKIKFTKDDFKYSFKLTTKFKVKGNIVYQDGERIGKLDKDKMRLIYDNGMVQSWGTT